MAGQSRHERALVALLEHRVLGLLWLDLELRVTARAGAVAEQVPVGTLLPEALPLLQGLEVELAALRSGTLDRFVLPNVGAELPGLSLPKSSLCLLFADDRYLVAILHVLSQSDLDVELTRQVRARRIAEERLLEVRAEVVRANEELTATNRELSEFTSIVSHDLGAPLRAMRRQCEELTQRLEQAVPELDDSIRAQIAGVRERIGLMSRMIRDLVEYASLGRRPELLEQVDLRALAEETCRTALAGTGFAWRLEGEWPVARTCRAPLATVLRNLVGNARQHHDRPTGTITLDCSSEPGACVLAVADDGPGLDPAHHAEIFAPFRRLGSAVGRPEGGTGIGLAIVKRIVELQAGEVQVSSAAGQRGARFVFRWHVESADETSQSQGTP